ncbi:hypothetical protein JXB02_06625 [Candidatus Woesearchaeota archaeon]|nr:hypothetical protein [Candidatus Woesearchaeota archaeon]
MKMIDRTRLVIMYAILALAVFVAVVGLITGGFGSNLTPLWIIILLALMWYNDYVFGRGAPLAGNTVASTGIMGMAILFALAYMYYNWWGRME